MKKKIKDMLWILAALCLIFGSWLVAEVLFKVLGI